MAIIVGGSWCNDDGSDNENGEKKAIVEISKTTTLHVHHAFLSISLPSLHDYHVKLLNFTFYGGRKHKTTLLPEFQEYSVELFAFREIQQFPNCLETFRGNRPFHGFFNVYMDKLGEIRRHHWKRRLKISETAKFESDTP